MTLCSDGGHTEIYFDGWCPLCQLIKEQATDIANKNNEIKDLETRLQNKNDEVARLLEEIDLIVFQLERQR